MKGEGQGGEGETRARQPDFLLLHSNSCIITSEQSSITAGETQWDKTEVKIWSEPGAKHTLDQSVGVKLE